MSAKNDNPDTYPALGRALNWVDQPGNPTKIFYALAVACVLIFLAGFTYTPYGEVAAEKIPGFFAVYGFVMFSFIIFAVRLLRIILKRPEDYYSPKSIDAEEYPADQLEVVDHDA